MPDPIQTDSRSTLTLASSPEDPETLVCSAVPHNSAREPVPTPRAETAPPLARGAAQLVEQYSGSQPRDASSCTSKAVAAADACVRAAALALQSTPTGVGPLIIGFSSGVLCGVKIVEAYQCYADSSARQP